MLGNTLKRIKNINKHHLWIIELFVWLFIIIFATTGFLYYKTVKNNHKNTYHIFMKDIDGLMKGSPIKIMGIQVGYVTQISIIDDYIYISFLISKPNVTIPHGSVALVESYGIAGSKSIELYPPKEKADETQSIIFVEEPIRSSSSYKTQGSIAKILITAAEGTSSLLNSKSVEQHRKNIQKLVELSGAKNLDTIDEKSDEMIETLESYKSKKEEATNEQSE